MEILYLKKKLTLQKYIELYEDLCKRCIKRIDKFLNDYSLKKKISMI